MCDRMAEIIPLERRMVEIFCRQCGRSNWRIIAEDRDARQILITEIRCRKCGATVKTAVK